MTHFFHLIVLALAAVAVGMPAAAEEAKALKLKPKTAMTTPPPATAHVPFVPSYTRDELPESALRMEAESKYVPNSCTSAGSPSLCYDYKSGRTVYKPTRNWMPDIPGMRPESITMKRDKLAFNYSFK
jgi:hypothetical protein